MGAASGTSPAEGRALPNLAETAAAAKRSTADSNCASPSTQWNPRPQLSTVKGEGQRTLVPGQCLTVVGRRPARSKEIAPRERSRAALAKKVGFIYLSPLRTLVALEPLVQVCQSRLQLVRRHVLWGYGWA